VVADVVEKSDGHPTSATVNPGREKVMLAFYAVIAVLTGAVLVWAARQPHTTVAASENESGPSVTVTLASGQSVTANFPPAEVAKFRPTLLNSLQ
jgi:hypothetical protein